MKIHRTIKGKKYTFDLTPDELRIAYNEMEDKYMRLDIDSLLEKTATLKFRNKKDEPAIEVTPALFKQSERFYNDIIYRKGKMDSYNEDYKYAMEDVLYYNGSEYIKGIIEEKFADKDLFFRDTNGDIRWVTYNPDSLSGGQFIDVTFTQDILRKAYFSDEKNDEYILSRCCASLIDANTIGFLDYADCIAKKKPDWEDFDSVINDVIVKNKKISQERAEMNRRNQNESLYSIEEEDDEQIINHSTRSR